MAGLLDPLHAPAPLVAALLRFARVRGVLVTDLAARLDAPDDGSAHRRPSLTPSVLRELFDSVAEATGEPHLGLRLASEQQLSTDYETLELAVRASATVADALVALARGASEVHPEVDAALVVDGRGGTWTQRSPSRPGGIGRHAEEYALAFVLARCRHECSTDPVRVRSLWLRHARPRDTAPLQRFFGADSVAFGADTSGFTLSTEVLRARLGSVPPEGRDARASTLGGARSMAAAVASKLPDLMPDHATLEGTARALAVSARTLQRRLEEERARFLDIQEAVREDLARTLLRDPTLPLVDIAERLGFADLATFSRAFKRWTGLPPGTFRRTRSHACFEDSATTRPAGSGTVDRYSRYPASSGAPG